MELWIYFFGFVATFVTIFGIKEYNNDYRYSRFEDRATVFFKSIIWPLTLLYGIGVGSGIVVKTYKENSLQKKQEQLRLEENHAKLLKEAGL